MNGEVRVILAAPRMAVKNGLTYKVWAAVIPRVWKIPRTGEEVSTVSRRATSRTSTFVAAFLALWTAGFTPLVQASNGLMPTSVGPVQNGRGGIDIGVADTPLSMNTNPAGITRYDFLAMGGSLGIFLPEIEYDDPDNEDTIGVHAVYPIPNFAIVFHEDFFQAPTIEAEGGKYFTDDEMLGFTDEFLRPKQLDFRPHFSFGVGLFVQGGAGSHIHLKSRLYPEKATYYSNFAFLALTPTVAYHFSPKFSMGFSLNLNYSTQKLNTLIGQDPSLLKQILALPGVPVDFAQTFRDFHDTNPASSLTELILSAPPFNNVSPADNARTMTGRFGLRDAKAYGLSGRLGLLWEPEPWLTVGAAYATRTWMTDYTGGRARVDFDKEISALGTTLDILTRGIAAALADPPVPGPAVFNPLIGYYDASIRDFNFPAQSAVGFSIHPPEEDWLVGVDVKYIQWADVLQNFTVMLENGSNPQLNALVGSNDPHPVAGDAARAPSPDIRTSLPLNFKNQWVFGLGGEYRVRPDLTLRAGYSFATEFAEDNTYMPITPAIVQHHLHMGFTYQVFANTTMDMSWEHGFRQDINVDRHESSDDLDFSQHKVSHDTIWTGFTVRY